MKKESNGIRDMRMEVQYVMLEQIVKEFCKEAIKEVLAELKKYNHGDSELLTIPQIAKKFQVTKTTIHNWRTRGLIVGHKLGKNRYYTEDEVNEALLRYGWESKLQDS